MVKPKRKSPAKKMGNQYRKSNTKTDLVKLIKSVSLRQQETKMAISASGAITLLHNVSAQVYQNLAATQQGITDGLSTLNRLGDTVTPIGFKLFVQLRSPADRPNVTYKMWIVKSWGTANPATFLPVKAITGNLLLDPVDTEKCSVVKTFTYKSPSNYWQGSLATSKENCFFKKLWIPLPRTPYVYGGDNGTLGKKFQYTLYCTAYDTVGTLITDNIGSVNVDCCFYFKDA